MKIEKHQPIEQGKRTAIQVLADIIPQISKQKLKLAMKYGAVWVTHLDKTTRLRRAKKELKRGDEIHLYYDEAILFSDIRPAELVADEGEYSVWNKPCGMLSQGSKWGDHTSIARWVELFGLSQNELPTRPCFLVHRLDRATNGLILVAHSKEMVSKLSALFENRKVIKKYRASVMGEFPKSLIGKPIESLVDDKTAISLVEEMNYNHTSNQSSLLVEIKTGRKHQIRKHLSELGFPVIGDRLYGTKPKTNENIPDLQLQSCYLEFNCPISDLPKIYRL